MKLGFLSNRGELAAGKWTLISEIGDQIAGGEEERRRGGWHESQRNIEEAECPRPSRGFGVWSPGVLRAYGLGREKAWYTPPEGELRSLPPPAAMTMNWRPLIW